MMFLKEGELSGEKTGDMAELEKVGEVEGGAGAAVTTGVAVLTPPGGAC